jgi:hypothetical protein
MRSTLVARRAETMEPRLALTAEASKSRTGSISIPCPTDSRCCPVALSGGLRSMASPPPAPFRFPLSVELRAHTDRRQRHARSKDLGESSGAVFVIRADAAIQAIDATLEDHRCPSPESAPAPAMPVALSRERGISCLERHPHVARR